MNIMTIENIVKNFTGRLLFDNLTFGIEDTDKIGIIGINGTGKSTLLGIIAGTVEPDEGNIVKGKNIKIAYLEQNPILDRNKTILENVLGNDEDCWEYEGKAKSILNKLGFSDYSAGIENLSGGEIKRIALAKTILRPADIMILDEPTNHLDGKMCEWLEDYLKKYTKAIVMVTHDRYFLDEVTNKILELDKSKIYSYETNYSGFLELKAQREEMILATERKNKSLYRVELEWMMRGARARSTKQKAHIQRFENLRDREKPQEDTQLEMSSVSSRLGKKTIELDGISKSFGERTLIDNFSYIFLRNDRIGIVGNNGCGKSTLLKIIMGIELPDAGSVDIGTTVKIGYFSQMNEYLDENMKVIDYVKETAEYIMTTEGRISASLMCEKFLFTPQMQYSLIGKLSGGEKRRLYLLNILMQQPNVLILDEPTNDLDIKTMTILEDYLTTFEGIVITVSHDRFFLDRVVSRIFAFEKDGKITQYEGGYTDYAAKKAASDDEEKKLSVTTGDEFTKNVKGQRTKGPQKLRFSYKEQKEYESIEQEMSNLENEIENIDKEIEASACDFVKLNKLVARKEELEETLNEKMDRWMYLEELAQLINNQ